MIPLRHYLDTSADTAAADWTINFKPTGYEAVQRGSGDNYYISSSTLNDLSVFDCADGPVPELGIVTAVTVHFRHRTTVGGTGGQVEFSLYRNSVAVGTSSTITPSTSWTDGSFRVTQDSVTSARFVASGMGDLEVAVEAVTAPSSGELRVSEMWLEVEWTLSPERYDPMTSAVTPDSITGDMAWSTTGTQTASISSNQLRIQDASTVDWRAYSRSLLEYGADYVTEVATRILLTTVTTGASFVFRIARVDDATYAPELCAFQDASDVSYIGLITDGLDRNDPAAYLATAQVDWTESHHYRLVVDRATDPGASDWVSVYLDYDSEPVMRVIYQDFTGTSSTATLEFGSGFAAETNSQCDALMDYYDWWTYHREGDWRHWYRQAVGANSVEINTTDSFIVPPIVITPPGIVAGQSERCCQLQVTDLADECSVRTYFLVPDIYATYKVAVDYRVDTFSENAKISVQRTTDHYYWNNGGAAWQAAASDVTLTYSPTRTRVEVMTDIPIAAENERLIIKLYNDTGASASHNVYLYKVDLRVQ